MLMAPDLELASQLLLDIMCTHCRFVPHFHPGAAEYFIGVRGKINLVAYINQKLVRPAVYQLFVYRSK